MSNLAGEREAVFHLKDAEAWLAQNHGAYSSHEHSAKVFADMLALVESMGRDPTRWTAARSKMAGKPDPLGRYSNGRKVDKVQFEVVRNILSDLNIEWPLVFSSLSIERVEKLEDAIIALGIPAPTTTLDITGPTTITKVADFVPQTWKKDDRVQFTHTDGIVYSGRVVGIAVTPQYGIGSGLIISLDKSIPGYDFDCLMQFEAHLQRWQPAPGFFCRRRWAHDQFGFSEPPDAWRADGTCSYCGSISPEALFEAINLGEEIDGTDKNYKLYVHRGGRQGKFYFQHFSLEDQIRFTTLFNGGKIRFSEPGLYVLPFFMAGSVTP